MRELSAVSSVTLMMEQRLIIFLFLTGALPLVLSIPRKYYLIQQLNTWHDAQVYCRANHTDLATIEGDANRVRFQDEVKSKQFTSSAWTGLYEEINNWRWSLGNVTLGSWTVWAASQPDYGPKEECAIINWDGYWLGKGCMNSYFFICFDERNSGTNRFIHYAVGKTWYDAQTYCRQRHTDLASSLNNVDNSEIVTVIARRGAENWFGLFRDAWKWSDRTSLSTINWAPGYNVDAHCGSINNDQYVNAPCSDLKPFFCYSVVTGQRQMIRIKVVSGQDVDDPSVKAAMLEKIQQMLKERGMGESISLTWKKNPDGKVFHKIKSQ